MSLWIYLGIYLAGVVLFAALLTRVDRDATSVCYGAIGWPVLFPLFLAIRLGMWLGDRWP